MADLVPRKSRSRGGSLSPRSSHPMGRLRDELSALFDDFLSGWHVPWQGVDFERNWNFDVEDRDDEVFVRAELPGFDANDLDVQLRDDVLTVQAAKTEEEKPEQGGYRRESRSFFRQVVLPHGIDAGKAQANYRNGVLELHLPRSEEARAKRIAVQSGGEQPRLQQQAGPEAREAGAGAPSGEQKDKTAPRAGTTPTGSQYTPGTNTGGMKAGGQSAADVTGGGAGGDIDNPDVAGRGTTPGAKPARKH